MMQAAAPSPVASLARKSLRQKILKAALEEADFRRLLEEAATEIRSLATPKATEATIEGAFERVLYARLREIGLLFHPEKQFAVNTRRHVTRGRLDSRLGALVVEYKRPSLLKSSSELEKSLQQLNEYLIAISEGAGLAIGLLINGRVMVEVRACDGTVLTTSSAEKITGASLLRVTRHFISLALTALTPSNLIRDFCGSEREGVLFQTARVLYAALATPQPKTKMLQSEWEEMFRLAHDDQSQQRRIEERREALGALLCTPVTSAEAEYRALFCLHTAYAILLKFLAYRTVSDLYLHQVGQDYRSLASALDEPLRAFCDDLEDGEVFRNLGIINLLEGDFFSWYSDEGQWTHELAESVRAILEILSRYEEAERIFEANEAPDLFRDIYQAAVPRVVRSSFGEFYTPFWLAEHVLDSAAPGSGWRALDPCCGSGTFIVAAIARLRRECSLEGFSKAETLAAVLGRVVAIDLNPLAVLTTRINYFIHVSDLLEAQNASLVIPVFLGDAASLPHRVSLDDVPCLSFELKTLKKPITAILPESLVRDTPGFMNLMVTYERNVQAQKKEAAKALLLNATAPEERTWSVRRAIMNLTDELVDLERKGWNGIWARILSNFLTTACLDKFDVIIGNPPWIDWKNLPEGYRNRIKAMCVERGLFSGARRTGGINLNICALISYVVLSNWLARSGRLAFLMPRELATQASYEGWRRLGGMWSFLEFHDWSQAGHPFDPVREDFMTFVIGSRSDERPTVATTHYKKPKQRTAEDSTRSRHLSAFDGAELLVADGVAGQIIPGSTAFTFASDISELNAFASVAGHCEYLGREGIQFYPQEAQVFRFAGNGPRPGTVWLNNVQARRSRYKVPRNRILVEERYLRPLVAAPAIKRFEHHYDGLLVAFPYLEEESTKPIPPEVLAETSPLLLSYYQKHRATIKKLSKFNERIRGANAGAYYGLARTGPYRFANFYVAFRKDTQWCAAVVSAERVPWGGERSLVFQSHAVSICERSDRSFIGENEAHFICAVLNAPVVERFIYAASDERSYKVRPPIHVPSYDATNKVHVELSKLSKRAHADPSKRAAIRKRIDELYLRLCGERPTRETRRIAMTMQEQKDQGGADSFDRFERLARQLLQVTKEEISDGATPDRRAKKGTRKKPTG